MHENSLSIQLFKPPVIQLVMTNLSILVTVCYFVKVKQGLVDGLLQLESHLHGIKACPPLIAVRLLQRSRLHIVTYLMNQNNINLL